LMLTYGQTQIHYNIDGTYNLFNYMIVFTISMIEL